MIKQALPTTHGSGIELYDDDFENWWDGLQAGSTNRAVVTIPALMFWVAVWREAP